MASTLPRQRATARLRIRQGAATTLADIAGYIEAGAVFQPNAEVDGQEVGGNRRWFELPQQRFVWSGASDAVSDMQALSARSDMRVHRRPDGSIRVLSDAERKSVFGTFDYREGADGAIVIDSSWVRANLTEIDVPALAHLGRTKLTVHKKAAKAFSDVFQKIQSADLAHLIKTRDGTWVARHMGWNPRRALSSHSWGAAIDINARWNAYGVVPAGLGATGSVRELVPIFESEGFAWGGYFQPLAFSDGMHFELSRLDL